MFGKNNKKTFDVTITISAKDETEAQQKVQSIQLIASKIDTDNLSLLGQVASKLGVNQFIKLHKNKFLMF